MTLTLILLIPALLILLLCWCSRRFEAPEDQPLELRQPRFVQGVFLFGVLGFAAVAIGLPLTTGETEYSPYLAAITLLTSLIAPFGFISRIRYGESGLTIRTYWGRVYAFRWEDISSVKAGAPYQPEARQRRDGHIIARGHKFYVNYSLPGAEDFIAYAQEKSQQRDAALTESKQ